MLLLFIFLTTVSFCPSHQALATTSPANWMVAQNVFTTTNGALNLSALITEATTAYNEATALPSTVLNKGSLQSEASAFLQNIQNNYNFCISKTSASANPTTTTDDITQIQNICSASAITTVQNTIKYIRTKIALASIPTIIATATSLVADADSNADGAINDAFALSESITQKQELLAKARAFKTDGTAVDVHYLAHLPVDVPSTLATLEPDDKAAATFQNVTTMISTIKTMLKEATVRSPVNQTAPYSRIEQIMQLRAQINTAAQAPTTSAIQSFNAAKTLFTSSNQAALNNTVTAATSAVAAAKGLASDDPLFMAAATALQTAQNNYTYYTTQSALYTPSPPTSFSSINAAIKVQQDADAVVAKIQTILANNPQALASVTVLQATIACNAALITATEADAAASAAISSAQELDQSIQTNQTLLLQAQNLKRNNTTNSGTQIHLAYLNLQTANCAQLKANLTNAAPQTTIATANTILSRANAILADTTIRSVPTEPLNTAEQIAALQASINAATLTVTQAGLTTIKDTLTQAQSALTTETNALASTLALANNLQSGNTNKPTFINQIGQLQTPLTTATNDINQKVTSVASFMTKQYTNVADMNADLATAQSYTTVATTILSKHDAAMAQINALTTSITNAQTADNLVTATQNANTMVQLAIKALTAAQPIITDANTKLSTVIAAAQALPSSLAVQQLIRQAQAMQNNGQNPPSGLQVYADYIASALTNLGGLPPTYSSADYANKITAQAQAIRDFANALVTQQQTILDIVNGLSNSVMPMKSAADLTSATQAATNLIAATLSSLTNAQKTADLANASATKLVDAAIGLPANTPGGFVVQANALKQRTQQTVNDLAAAIKNVQSKPQTYASIDLATAITAAGSDVNNAAALAAQILDVHNQATINDAISTLQQAIETAQATATNAQALTEATQKAQAFIAATIAKLHQAEPLAQTTSDTASQLYTTATNLPANTVNRDTLIARATALKTNTQLDLQNIQTALATLPQKPTTYATIALAKADMDAASDTGKANTLATRICDAAAQQALTTTINTLQTDLTNADNNAATEAAAAKVLADAKTTAITLINNIISQITQANPQDLATKTNTAAAAAVTAANALPSNAQNRADLIAQANALQQATQAAVDTVTRTSNALQKSVTELQNQQTTTYTSVQSVTDAQTTATKMQASIQAIIDGQSSMQQSITDLQARISKSSTQLITTQMVGATLNATSNTTSTRSGSSATLSSADTQTLVTALAAASDAITSVQAQCQKVLDQATSVATTATSLKASPANNQIKANCINNKSSLIALLKNITSTKASIASQVPPFTVGTSALKAQNIANNGSSYAAQAASLIAARKSTTDSLQSQVNAAMTPTS